MRVPVHEACPPPLRGQGCLQVGPKVWLMDGLTLAAAPAKPRTPERPGKERRGQGQGDGTGRGDSWARCRVAHLAPPLERGPAVSCRPAPPCPVGYTQPGVTSRNFWLDQKRNRPAQGPGAGGRAKGPLSHVSCAHTWTELDTPGRSTALGHLGSRAGGQVEGSEATFRMRGEQGGPQPHLSED